MGGAFSGIGGAPSLASGASSHHISHHLNVVPLHAIAAPSYHVSYVVSVVLWIAHLVKLLLGPGRNTCNKARLQDVIESTALCPSLLWKCKSYHLSRCPCFTCLLMSCLASFNSRTVPLLSRKAFSLCLALWLQKFGTVTQACSSGHCLWVHLFVHLCP